MVQRLVIVDRLFGLLDRDGDGFLCAGKLVVLARMDGDTGSDDEWPNEFRDSCAHLGADAEAGLD
eukprot:11520541-Alexandrium_andersonii.AAC.1